MFNEDQQNAIKAMKEFLATPIVDCTPDELFFILRGSAGTGKTFCMKSVVRDIKGRFLFTAPTNKAVRVLKKTLTENGAVPECRTIFSVLGLKLEANGEIKELAVPDEIPDFSRYAGVVLDEGSMAGMNLYPHILRTAKEQRIKFIVMLDPAQLPPVGELHSPFTKIEAPSAMLHKVMRYDNAILALADNLRSKVDHPAPKLELSSDNDGEEGVWKLSEGEFMARIFEAADTGKFSEPDGCKVIAWRNVTVDAWNQRIRARLYKEASDTRFLRGDRVVVTGMAKDLEDNIIAVTDDEGTLQAAEVDDHPKYPEFRVWRLTLLTDENKLIVLRVLHEDSMLAFERKKEELAAAARLERRRWGAFWNFIEAFNGVRHAYAITAHRSQGSTFSETFVDWRDILLNQNRAEGRRCLYVACTRPKTKLYLN